MFTAATFAVLISLALLVARALAGPTIFDRLVAANAIGTAAILLLAVFGFLTDRPEFLDIGILYALLNLVGTLAVLKYFRFGDLAHSGGEEPEN
ncbi:monovalent cation/H+ antiporter complex subunit F [Tepidamorphus sp. 3E244]|uniref:monovalent cation/H+ antiporter complex subunit F n=1 Tax=Tepidamorphus sp. 3E244 TaxID=3385498 RepID=UPI0038FBF2EA